MLWSNYFFPVCNGLEKYSLHHSKVIEEITSLFASVMPCFAIYFHQFNPIDTQHRNVDLCQISKVSSLVQLMLASLPHFCVQTSQRYPLLSLPPLHLHCKMWTFSLLSPAAADVAVVPLLHLLNILWRASGLLSQMTYLRAKLSLSLGVSVVRAVHHHIWCCLFHFYLHLSCWQDQDLYLVLLLY